MWEKIDKDNLPDREVLAFCDGEFLLGTLKYYSPNLYVEDDSGRCLFQPTHYLDPSTLPKPGEVKLDWWDYGDFSEAIFDGKKFMLEQDVTVTWGYIYDSPDQDDGRLILHKATLAAAKSACEKYAAEMLNDKAE